jgi:hypothetical protein
VGGACCAVIIIPGEGLIDCQIIHWDSLLQDLQQCFSFLLATNEQVEAAAFLCYHTSTMTRRRLILYLLLNALVSVLVSGTVLFFYDRANHKTDCNSSSAIPTLPAGSINANIMNVSGVGALASETVVLQNNGSTAILLTSWTLKDDLGSIYTFPELTLYPAGMVKVHSGPGTNTAADLYWGLPAPVWKSGDLVALYDTQNIARAFYRVP